MKILKIDKKNLRKIVRIAEKSIREGKIIICPTDTVYGLLCDATNKKAVTRLFKIKKRSKVKPIPIFVKDFKMAKKLAFINKKQEKILRIAWPGKVTFILKRKKSKMRLYGISKKTVGLRIPNYRLINLLLEKFNRPLTGTSANISGKSSSTKIKQILRQFEKDSVPERVRYGTRKIKPDLVLDVGNLEFSLPSIVLALTGKTIKIFRI